MPSQLSADLDAFVPQNKRSRFVSAALSQALKQKNTEDLVSAIDRIEPWQPAELSVVEVIRKLRTSKHG